MDKFLQTQKLSILIHREIEKLNRPKICRDWAGNQKLPAKENPVLDGFTGEF